MLLLVVNVCSCHSLRDEWPRMTHGILSAEVTDSTALIWSRTDQPARMHVELWPPHAARTVEVSAATDFTGQVSLANLRANTRYRYAVWFSPLQGGAGKPPAHLVSEGTFTTAPAADQNAAVRIAWSGDFAGQNVCRDAQEGFPIFKSIAAEQADMFVGLGDMIYADNTCESVGRYGNQQVPGDFLQAADLGSFRAHWRYNREDPGFQRLLAMTPYYGVWDDHEVVNDFGPQTDTRRQPPYREGESLLPLGLQAFLEYTPMTQAGSSPHRLYRTVRWGQQAAVFFLDNRQYRDANRAPDGELNEKTMLGREQLTWLLAELKASDAVWNIIVTSVPLSIPTGFPPGGGRDGWANFDESEGLTSDGIPESETGFERELRQILAVLKDAASNTVFITTDVHFAEVFRYTLPDSDPAFTFHELVIGPGNAGLFPNRSFDRSLGTESLFFYGPESANAVTSWQEAKKWFNYGLIDIDESGKLTASLRKTDGEEVYRLTLSPSR